MVESGKCRGAGFSDEVIDVCLLGPAVGFVFFEFEFGDGFDRVIRNGDFDIGVVELVKCADCAGEGAVAFVVETGADGGEGVGEDGIVVGYRDGEASFECGKLG